MLNPGRTGVHPFKHACTEGNMDSIWSQSCPLREREPLDGDRETEVAVIGAGMAGVLTADLLQRAGRRVVVLEANRIGSGQTRYEIS